MLFREITDAAGREKKEVVETRKVKLASQPWKVFSHNRSDRFLARSRARWLCHGS